VVEDIDAVDSTKAKISLSRKKMVPLPHWRANPLSEEDALHKEGRRRFLPIWDENDFHPKFTFVNGELHIILKLRSLAIVDRSYFYCSSISEMGF